MGVTAFGQQPRSSEPLEGHSVGDESADGGTEVPGSDLAGFEYLDGGEVSESTSGDTRFVDPASIPSPTSGGNSGDSDAPYGRTPTGRIRNRPVANKPAGNGPKRTARTDKQVSALIADGVEWVHDILAKATKIEELEMSEEESLAIADAIVNVGEFYDVPIPDPKTMAWVNLGKVLAKAYGTRIVAARIRMKSQAKKKGPAVVNSFPSEWNQPVERQQ